MWFYSKQLSKIYKTCVAYKAESKPENENYEDMNELLFIGGTNEGKLESFPLGLNKVFPNLTVLGVYYHDIDSISLEDLKGLENLRTIEISGCQLKSLPSNLFENMEKLKNIYFSRNKLESISSDLLKPVLANGHHHRRIFQYHRTRVSLATVAHVHDRRSVHQAARRQIYQQET